MTIMQTNETMNTNQKPTTVIYHSADFDGIFCREVARRYLPSAQLIGWNFGDPKIPMPTEGLVYILDLSPECLEGDGIDIDYERIIWIDHHKTSIEKYAGYDIPGYRIDGVAACRLAWHWFTLYSHWDNRELYPPYDLPLQHDYVARNVNEPYALRLAGEYDIWDKRDPNADVFQYGLRACEPDFVRFLNNDLPYVDQVLGYGRVAQIYGANMNASICKSRTWLMEWEGLKFLCVNTAQFNSLLFAAKDVPETGHDALLGFCFNGKKWTVSLYHANHRKDIDLSEIAKNHGGGGHRGACGFTCDKLPFLNQ